MLKITTQRICILVAKERKKHSLGRQKRHMPKDLGKTYDLRELQEMSVNCLEPEAHGKCRLLHLLPLPLSYFLQSAATGFSFPCLMKMLIR